MPCSGRPRRSCDDALLHESSSGVSLGQNQPISATATGIEPQTTAQGVKIEQTSMTLVAIAVTERPDRSARRGFPRFGSRLNQRADDQFPPVERAGPVATGSVSRLVPKRIGASHDRDAGEVVARRRRGRGPFEGRRRPTDCRRPARRGDACGSRRRRTAGSPQPGSARSRLTNRLRPPHRMSGW